MAPTFDLAELLQAFGYVGMFLTIVGESGLFFGFILPGDSLLFTAGLLASQGIFSIWVLLPLLVVAAVLGGCVGYWTGRKLGGWLMHQKDSVLYKKQHLLKAQEFYERHGGKTLVIARFIPTIRTFAPIVAGMVNMPFGVFMTYNIMGGVLWALAVTLIGYFLGSVIPDVDKYVFPIIGAIVVVLAIGAFIKKRRGAHEEQSRGFSLSFRAKTWLNSVFRRD